MVSRLSTGIRILDDLLDGGIEKGSSVLLTANPFVDATPILQEWLYSRLLQGDKGLYFVNNRPPDIIMKEMESYGWPVAPYRDRNALVFIDAYSGILELKSKEAFFVENPVDSQQINETMLKAIKEMANGDVNLFFDSLNTLIDQCGTGVLDDVKDWSKFSIARDVTSIYAFTEWGYPHEITAAMEKIFDSVIELKALRRIVASEALTVSKIKRTKVKDKRIFPFRYIKPGGLRLYIPKILVTGPYNAGKTTVVHSLSTRAVSVQRMGTTVALDFGHVDHKGFSLDLFGTIGQPRFDPILDQLGGEALGVMLVVDSTKPEELPRAMEMMRKARVHGLPYVVLANKQDLSGAVSSEELRKKMHVPDEIPIIEIIATEKKNVTKALDALLEKFMGEK